MKPSVTLAIPTSNRRDYLAETLEGALQQSYENLEILVSDNGSTDGTRDLITQAAEADRRLRFRRNDTRIPVTTHFNQCLSEARGKYFILLSDDDRINPGFVESLASALAENPRATVAVPANCIIDDRGVLTRSLPAPSKDVYEGIHFAIEWLWKTHELPVANLVTVMGHTRLMRKFRYQFFPKGLHADDLLFLQMALAGQVVFSRKAIFHWRTHGAQQLQKSFARDVARAGRQLRQFVGNDRQLRQQIDSHHPAQQRLIRRGICRFTAETYLHQIGFFDKPLETKILRDLAPVLSNVTLLRLVLRHYYRHLFRRVSDSTSPVRV